MLPVLLNLGFVKIYSFGVCMAIGMYLAMYWWWKMGRDEHFDEIELFDSFFMSIIVFLIMGRIGYVLLHLSDLATIYRMLAVLAYPGLNVLSGVVGVILFMFLFARTKGWDKWKVADAWGVVLSLAITFGGLGGLLNGSTPGKAVTWGLMYPGESVARFPVDLLLFVWGLITFAVISRVRKNFRFYEWYKGEASVAQEGLAALIFLLSSGIYFLIIPWFMDSPIKLSIFPVIFLVGIVGVGVAIYGINMRMGRRNMGLWGKLSNIIRRK